MAAKIKGTPDKTISGLSAPALGEGRTMSSSWTVPAAMIKSSYKRRATALIVNWNFALSGGTKTLTSSVGTGTTSSSVNLNSFNIGGTTYSRSSFYPISTNKLASVSISVAGNNTKGNGAAVTQTRAFTTPPAPTIDEIEFNTSTGRCTTTVRTEEVEGYNERYDTRYRVTVKGRTGTTATSSDSSSTGTEINLQYDASDYQNLTYDQFIRVTVEAWNRGYAGDSRTASRNFYLSYPAKATITGTSVSAKDSTGKLTVSINTNRSTEHPVDTVKLEYLANVSYENASDIPAGDEWSDSGIEDNGDCTALAMPVGNLVPDRGKYTWVRVKTTHAHEGLLVRYSDYKRLEELETPAAESAEDSIVILSAVSGADGESAVVLLGWNASGTDDSTGTELTWSDEENTWKSTKQPDSHEFTWSDGRYPPTGTIQYNDSAEITIKGLSEGKKYYIRARRYYDGETVSYGRYSNTATVVTSEKPIGVVAICNKYVTDGQPLSIYWTFSGNGLQKEWQIIGTNGTVIAKGEGSMGSTQISAKRLADLATNNSLSFTVQVSTGSGFVSSETKTVTILHKPTLTVTETATLTAQPYSFVANSSRLCDLIVIVSAQGASGQFPQGVLTQTAGDTIHSDVYTPIWSNGSATVTLPSGLDFWNLGGYTLSVTAVDRETGLRSDEVVKSFNVQWTVTAVDPDEFVTLTPVDTVSEEDEHIQGVEIALTAPTSSSATDVYDIYRMDGENAHLIGEGFPLAKTVLDKYAPFSSDSDLYYRIALRTIDGDVEFTDKEYTLTSDTIRFDWSGGALELPYGNSIGDSYKKTVEFRQHLDGSVDGYWNKNIERGASYNSAIIKLMQPEEINLARQLARYAGAVFVRTSNGSAFVADVQVTDMSVKNQAVTAIAIDATEVGMTEEFMLPSPFEQEE